MDRSRVSLEHASAMGQALAIRIAQIGHVHNSTARSLSARQGPKNKTAIGAVIGAFEPPQEVRTANAFIVGPQAPPSGPQASLAAHQACAHQGPERAQYLSYDSTLQRPYRGL